MVLGPMIGGIFLCPRGPCPLPISVVLWRQFTQEAGNFFDLALAELKEDRDGLE